MKFFFAHKNLMQGFAVCLLLSGCSSTPEEYVERPVDELYEEGRAHLHDGQYEKAGASFDEVERQHPYSEWAAQGQIMSAYAYYLAQKYEKALVALESFIALHPSHVDAPYAYYLKGLCYFEQTTAVERDQKVTEMTLDAFRELVKKYPTSQYARDGRIKIDFLMDCLASRHMDVGRYYQRRQAHTAAINRFKEVVLNYQTTSQVEEALYRLIEIYTTIGMTTEAKKISHVLAYNYPHTYWFKKSQALVASNAYDAQEFKRDVDGWSRTKTKSQNPGLAVNAEVTKSGTMELKKHALKGDENYNAQDLARPVERFGSTQGYLKAKQKLDQERSVIDKISGLFKSKQDSKAPKESPNA